MPALNWRQYLDESMLPHLWCPGCGNGITLGAVARALAELNLRRNEVVVVTGIGCWGKADDYLATNALHGTHGRALAFATGVKAA
ncbi:MAG: 2-oxoacid:ferredoxin oxidoreductase subunit beta, partial [Desulfotomaculales bacterium]